MDGNLHTMQVPVHVLSVDKKELHHAAPFSICDLLCSGFCEGKLTMEPSPFCY